MDKGREDAMAAKEFPQLIVGLATSV